MTVKGQWNLRKWLRIDEAAEYLSSRLPDRYSPADVLRLAIDGNLATSLYLPTEVIARCKPRDAAIDVTEKNCRVQGLCDVPMVGRARLQIDRDYQWLELRSLVLMDGPVGAIVEHEGMRCQLPPDRGESSGISGRSKSEFPQGAVLCVRTSVLETFAQEYSAAHPVIPHKEQSAAQPVVSAVMVTEPLDRRERISLLIIIAAVADNGVVDVKGPGAADTIRLWTEKIGAPLDKRTIQNHLSQIPDALEQKRT